jgi:hypothetical protein
VAMVRGCGGDEGWQRWVNRSRCGAHGRCSACSNSREATFLGRPVFLWHGRRPDERVVVGGRTCWGEDGLTQHIEQHHEGLQGSIIS